uniref:Wsv332-like protein n=1 Tax=Melicertus latisulcatus majanivirus TaxID=2984277 RepID=A0A9C7BQA8_9VIRU|nr:MAG: wsv332-like protein [Melicertus latisulcatus majanivirus]
MANNLNGLFIEKGMCIVNIDSITQRLQNIKLGTKEAEIVERESINFLSTIASLCHGEETMKMFPYFETLGKTLVEIFKNHEIMSITHKTSNDHRDNLDHDDDNDNANSVTGDSTHFLQDMSLDVIKSFLSSTTEVDSLIRSTVKVLGGYNPFKLKENLYIIKCNRDKGVSCICTRFTEELASSADNPVFVLSRVLQLFCHDIVDDDDSEKRLANDVIKVPMKYILLNLIDTYSGEASYRNIDSFVPAEIHSQNTEWTNLIRTKVMKIPLDYRCFIMLIYCALLFFPNCKSYQTFKLVNLYMEIILLKMCYHTAETLSCASINSTSEKDGGNFLSYINSYTATNIISSTVRTEKAILDVYQKENLKEIIKVLTNNNHIAGDMNNERVTRKILAEMKRIFTASNYLKPPSRYAESRVVHQHKSHVRNVRSVELFKIIGEISIEKSNNVRVVFNNNIINRYSKGNNIKVNHFHLLSMLPRANNLSSDYNSQCCIENYFDDRQKFSFGNFAGWWLGIIDGTIEENGKKLNSKDNNDNNIMRRILSDTIREVYKNRLVSSKLLAFSHLPDHKTIENNGCGMLDITGNRIEAQESQRQCLFSSILIPDIIGANCSILAPMQIELALTRPTGWLQFVTKIMYFIERFNIDCYKEVLKFIVESKNNDGHDSKSQFIKNLPQIFKDGVISDENSKHITAIIQEAFNNIKYQYVEGSTMCSQIPDYRLGEKRLALFDKIYDILRDIIIVNNHNPQTYLKHSHLLLNIYSEIDSFLINILKAKEHTTYTYGNKRPKIDEKDDVEYMDTF